MHNIILSTTLIRPTGIFIDQTGTNLFIADTGNDAVKRIDLSSGNWWTLRIQSTSDGQANSDSTVKGKTIIKYDKIENMCCDMMCYQMNWINQM